MKCAICGEHANEHGAINHEFVEDKMKDTRILKVPPLPGRVPERGMQYCHFCRTGERYAFDLYCACSNKNCPYPIGESSKAVVIERFSGTRAGTT